MKGLEDHRPKVVTGGALRMHVAAKLPEKMLAAAGMADDATLLIIDVCKS